MERVVEGLGPLALAFVFVGIVIAFGSVILTEIGSLDVVADTDSTASGVIESTQGALDTFGSFLGVIAVVSLASTIFLLLRSVSVIGRQPGQV